MSIMSNKKTGHNGGRKPLNPAIVIGLQFGRLTVIGIAPRKSATNRATRVECVCSCGNSDNAVIRLQDLLDESTKSCGCLQDEVYKKHWDGKANNLPDMLRAHIFMAACNTPNEHVDIAERFHQPVGMIGGAFRVHAQWLLDKFVSLIQTRKYTPSAFTLGITEIERNWLNANVSIPAGEPINIDDDLLQQYSFSVAA